MQISNQRNVPPRVPQPAGTTLSHRPFKADLERWNEYESR